MDPQEDLEERLAFVGLDPPGLEALRRGAPVISAAMGPALGLFYDKIRRTPALSGMFASQGHMDKASVRQQAHWEAISRGALDQAYVASAKAVGRIHARIGLAPRWYIGGCAVLTGRLVREISLAERRRFARNRRSREGVADTLAAVVAAAFLDMDLAISTYIESLDEERRRLEAVRADAEAEQGALVAALGSALEKVAKGDLTARVETPVSAAFQNLKDDFNTSLEALRVALLGVADTSDAISAGTDQIGVAADDFSRRTENQAASLEETAAALDEITATVRRTAAGAAQASEAAAAAKAQAEQSDAIVDEAIAAMETISKSSREIGAIITVIDEIAFQTNLLALNAGVEAARAGDAGRGFAVVAQEVRALAQRSATAAREIKDLIAASGAQVEQGVRLVDRTGVALRGIVGKVAEIDGLINDIATSAKEESAGLAEVNTAVNQMDQVTQQNAAMVEETAAATHALRGQAGDLVALISSFRLSAGPALNAPVVSLTRPAAGRPAPPMARGAITPTPGRIPPRSSPRPSAGGARPAVLAAHDTWEEF